MAGGGHGVRPVVGSKQLVFEVAIGAVRLSPSRLLRPSASSQAFGRRSCPPAGAPRPRTPKTGACPPMSNEKTAPQREFFSGKKGRCPGGKADPGIALIAAGAARTEEGHIASPCSRSRQYVMRLCQLSSPPLEVITTLNAPPSDGPPVPMPTSSKGLPLGSTVAFLKPLRSFSRSRFRLLPAMARPFDRAAIAFVPVRVRCPLHFAARGRPCRSGGGPGSRSAAGCARARRRSGR